MAWTKEAQLKSDLAFLYGASLVAAFIVFFIALLKGASAWQASPKGAALDFAVLAFCESVMALSMGGLVVNNFIFLGERKDWHNFWSADMLEYFTNLRITERWRAARGRFIFSFVTFLSGFIFFQAYGWLRELAR